MPTDSSRPVTLHDVARVAGVSLITASRALRRPDIVAAETIERVQRAVAETGYLPNLLAGGLKSNRSYTVAALVPGIAVPQFLPTIQALTDGLDRAGYQLLLGQTGYYGARESRLLDAMLSRRVDAIVVTGLVRADGAADALRRRGIPVVETWDLTGRPVDMLVGFSHVKVGGAVAGYFLSRRWQRVAIVTADDQRAMQRCDGFVSAFGRRVPTIVVPAPTSLPLGRKALADLLAVEPSVEALWCSSDALAHGVMIEAAARGIEVPGRLAVCGFGDADFAAYLVPALTTVRVDAAAIGTRAAELVVRRCRGERIDERVVDVGFELVERASTLRAPG